MSHAVLFVPFSQYDPRFSDACLWNECFYGYLSPPFFCRFPTTNALAVKRDGAWKFTTYAEYYQQVRTVAKAFIKLGLQQYHGVCILGFNSPEWFISDLAAVFAG